MVAARHQFGRGGMGVTLGAGWWVALTPNRIELRAATPGAHYDILGAFRINIDIISS